MPDTKLAAELRSEKGTRPAGRLRREGLLPGVVYGLGEEAVSVTVNAHQLGNILSSRTGANTLITLQIGGKDELALARQVQRDAVKGTLVHVDFVRVRADQTIQAEVRLNLLGSPEGVTAGRHARAAHAHAHRRGQARPAPDRDRARRDRAEPRRPAPGRRRAAARGRSRHERRRKTSSR